MVFKRIRGAISKRRAAKIEREFTRRTTEEELATLKTVTRSFDHCAKFVKQYRQLQDPSEKQVLLDVASSPRVEVKARADSERHKVLEALSMRGLLLKQPVKLSATGRAGIMTRYTLNTRVTGTCSCAPQICKSEQMCNSETRGGTGSQGVSMFSGYSEQQRRQFEEEARRREREQEEYERALKEEEKEER